MSYFKNITSFADLKKQYRQLALVNHPDKGGDTAVMQAINQEFDRLFEIWKDRKETDFNGYENDFTEAKTSRQYTDYVWREYRWRGSRYDHNLKKNDLAEKFREFVKEAYPRCKFSIRSGWAGCTYTFHISLVQADFEAFTPEYREQRGSVQLNHYYLQKEDRITDRCREVMQNIIDFCESFNYDNSDSMTDYFDVNYYATYSVGTSEKYFTYMPPQLKSAEPIYKRKPTPTERAIQQAIGAGNIISENKVWNNKEGYVKTDRLVLMKNDDLSKEMGYPIYYSQPSLLKKRLEAMRAVGIICDNFDKKRNKRSSAIWVEGFTPELQAKLDKERAEEDAREKAFYAKQTTSADEQDKSATKQTMPISCNFEIIDYSEKAIALIGDTKPIADKLKELGGRFNPRLSCGAGWIFSKRKETELRNLLNIAA